MGGWGLEDLNKKPKTTGAGLLIGDLLYTAGGVLPSGATSAAGRNKRTGHGARYSSLTQAFLLKLGGVSQLRPGRCANLGG